MLRSSSSLSSLGQSSSSTSQSQQQLARSLGSKRAICAVCESSDPLQKAQLFVCLGCRASFHTSCVKARPIPFQRNEAEWEGYVRKHFAAWRCATCLSRAAHDEEVWERGEEGGMEEGGEGWRGGGGGGGGSFLLDSPGSVGSGGGKKADSTNFAYVGATRQVGR